MKTKMSMVIFGVFILIFLIVFSGLYYLNRNSIFLTLLMCTPAVSVILTRMNAKEGFKNLSIKPDFKKNMKFYISAYLLTPFVAYAGAILYFIMFRGDLDFLGSKFAVSSGAKDMESYISNLLAAIPLAIIVNPLMGIVQCFGEEFAWRGYLLPKLSKYFTPQRAVIINGVIWGIWHSPIIAMGFNYGTEKPLFGVLAMIILCVVFGIIESYLFFKTESIWAPVLFHASVNGIDLYKPSELFMSKEPDLFIGPDLTGVIGGMGFIVIALILFFKLSGLQNPNLK